MDDSSLTPFWIRAAVNAGSVNLDTCKSAGLEAARGLRARLGIPYTLILQSHGTWRDVCDWEQFAIAFSVHVAT
jgi:hypothetical protein